MTSLDPKQPLREPTPQERARATRTVWLILLGLPSIVGVMVASLTLGGRQVRDYGREVIRTALNSPSVMSGDHGQDCRKLAPALPDGVQSCRVERTRDGLLVTLTMDRGRQYQVSSTDGKVTDKVNTAEVAARTYAQQVASRFPAFVKANAPTALEVQAVPCAKVVAFPAPAGVQSCQVQSGPADGPEVALKLEDGRTLTVGF